MTIQKAKKILGEEALLQKKARHYRVNPEKYRKELELWIAIEEAKESQNHPVINDLTVQLVQLQRTIDEECR